MKAIYVLCALAAVVIWAANAQPVLQLDRTKQQAFLDQLRSILPPSVEWETWLQETGELPPDFDALPGAPFLPDPMRFSDGQAVQSRVQWLRRRAELLRLFQHYVFGTVPPAPGNVRAADIKSRSETGATVQSIELEFGPQRQAKIGIELIVPPGKGPFPAFVTLKNQRQWALVAVSRGYIGCVCAEATASSSSGGYADLWPGYDWGKLAQQAWALSRCVDYLATLPIVDRSQIALAGHSQNGKVCLIAAALDDRFAAVISSSSGAGGAGSFRFFSEAQFGQGIEMLTRINPELFHPRLRFFVGRENKLPIDEHELIACIAPRPCLVSTALNDPAESVFAVEQTIYGAQQVYSFLGAGSALSLRFRHGSHEVQSAEVESFLDWLDTKFGKGRFAVVNRPIYPTYAFWRQASGERIDPLQYAESGLSGLLTTRGGNPILNADQWNAKRQEMRTRVLWGLGQAPAAAASEVAGYSAEPLHIAALFGRASLPPDLVKRSVRFGNCLSGDLYYPADTSQGQRRIPAVIWLHPISSATGYTAGAYGGQQIYLALARAGFAVFAFDQIGNGSRLEEAQRFYQRYPLWSLLGKTVQDTVAAVDALAGLDFIDPRKIYLLGYSTGAMAALHAAALDDRIAGIVSVAGFTPMRLDTADKGTGGVSRWSQLLPLQPRLGAFVGFETRIPYDYHEVLALIAPRPVLVVAPQIDFSSTNNDIVQCLTAAGQIYQWLGAPNNLMFLEPFAYNHLSPELQQELISRLKQIAGAP